jgi:cephalosporin hydroxylase
MGLERHLKKMVVPFFRIYENFIINRFHNIYYNGRFNERHIFKRTHWLEIPCAKCPLDMWIYQEIITEIKPDLIIETGTYLGGSALFMAHILDILDKGSIISIDVEEYSRTDHPRIQYITGSSTDRDLVESVVDRRDRDTCLVILDSDHSKDHVRQEIELLSHYVSVGSYLIIEDTNINGHPTFRKFGPGPYEAVVEFLKRNDDFVLDRSKEKFLMTFNPIGYLKRVK